MDLFQVRMTVTEMVDVVTATFGDSMKEVFQNDVFLAGGVFKSLVLDETPNDWDFYFKTKEGLSRFLDFVSKNNYFQPTSLTNRDKIKSSKISLITDNAITFKFPKATIQFIIFETGKPEEIISRFDFLHTQSYYDPATAKLECPTQHIVGKELAFNPKAYTPLSAMKRMTKFIKQGWTISDEHVEALAQAIAGVNWKDPVEVKKQRRGMYGSIIQGIRSGRSIEQPVDPEPAPAPFAGISFREDSDAADTAYFGLQYVDINTL